MNGQLVGTTDYALPPEKRNIGIVFQSFALWSHMKVKEQIEFPLLYHKDVPEELRARKNERVEEVLDMVGIYYTVDTGSQQVEVHGPIHKPFRINDEVFLKLVN